MWQWKTSAFVQSSAASVSRVYHQRRFTGMWWRNWGMVLLITAQWRNRQLNSNVAEIAWKLTPLLGGWSLSPHRRSLSDTWHDADRLTNNITVHCHRGVYLPKVCFMRLSATNWKWQGVSSLSPETPLAWWEVDLTHHVHDNLAILEADPKRFLRQFVTMDETWVYHVHQRGKSSQNTKNEEFGAPKDAKSKMSTARWKPPFSKIGFSSNSLE